MGQDFLTQQKESKMTSTTQPDKPVKPPAEQNDTPKEEEK
jgi:hypothetical protein